MNICISEASLAEQGAHDQAPTRKGHILEIQMRTGCKGGTWKHCLGLQGWCQKKQSLELKWQGMLQAVRRPLTAT